MTNSPLWAKKGIAISANESMRLTCGSDSLVLDGITGMQDKLSQ
ncbi:hypothetical protein ACPCXA_03065 [Lysinibacillus agricola]